MLATEYLEELLCFDGSLSQKALKIAKEMEIENMIEFAENYAQDVCGGCNLTAEEYYNYLQSKK